MSKTDPPIVLDATDHAQNVATDATAQQHGVENDHDIFLRGLLSITVLLLKQLKYVLPPPILAYAKLETLKPAPETHVDSKMRYMASDSIYECEIDLSKLPPNNHSKRKVPPIRFAFLMEGKSGKPSEPVDFQIEDYRKAIWSRDLKNKQFPGLVLPILIYSGKTKWNRRIMYDKFSLFLPDDLLEYVPHYKYLIIDLYSVTDSEIIDNVDLGALRSAFLALKHGHDPNYFKTAIPNLFNFALEDADLAANSNDSEAKYLLHEFLKLLSAYIQRRAKMSEKEVIETILKSKNQIMATKVRTMFDIVEERGIEKGIALGEAKSEEKVKQAEAKAKETEAKAKETEAKLHEIVKLLMLTTPMSDEQLIKQFKLMPALVTQLRKEIADKS
jgi:Putative transposase, YhgA-like